MGNTYETDKVETRDEFQILVQAAVVMRSLSNLVGCKSWLVARLALKELRQRVDELAQTIEVGSK